MSALQSWEVSASPRFSMYNGKFNHEQLNSPLVAVPAEQGGSANRGLL